MKLLREFADYAWRVFRHLDFICGGVLAIVYFYLAGHEYRVPIFIDEAA